MPREGNNAREFSTPSKLAHVQTPAPRLLGVPRLEAGQDRLRGILVGRLVARRQVNLEFRKSRALGAACPPPWFHRSENLDIPYRKSQYRRMLRHGMWSRKVEIGH